MLDGVVFAVTCQRRYLLMADGDVVQNEATSKQRARRLASDLLAR